MNPVCLYLDRPLGGNSLVRKLDCEPTLQEWAKHNLSNRSYIDPTLVALQNSLAHQSRFLFLSIERFCFFSQSLIASSTAAACVISKRAQMTSNSILSSFGILPRTSLTSSFIFLTALISLIVTRQIVPSLICGICLLRFCAIASKIWGQSLNWLSSRIQILIELLGNRSQTVCTS